MKVLVEKSSGLIKGGYDSPFKSSIAGHYIIDVPSNLNVPLSSSSVGDLIAAKTQAILDLHPSLPYFFTDEFANPSYIDTALSSRYITGSPKQTCILPGGRIVTPTLLLATNTTLAFIHFNIFTLFSDPGPQPPSTLETKPQPKRLLYNYDPSVSDFVEPSVGSLTVSVVDTSDVVVYSTLTADTEVSFVQSSGLNFKLRFENTSSSRLWLSDFTFLYG